MIEQAAAFYQECPVECSLEELALREGCSFERAIPDERHFGTPECALHLSWDQQRMARVRVARVMEIYMGYAGTLLIAGKNVTVLRHHQWQQNRSLVQQALERAYQEPRVETRVADNSR